MTKKDWQLQLQDPTGKVWVLGELGYASSTPELSHVLSKVRKYLQSEECTWSGKEFVLADLYQMMLNANFYQYHCFRIVWGAAPTWECRGLDNYSPYPNGRDTVWHLCYESNGRVEVCMGSNLPDNWWQMDDHEQDQWLEHNIQEQ